MSARRPPPGAPAARPCSARDVAECALDAHLVLDIFQTESPRILHSGRRSHYAAHRPRVSGSGRPHEPPRRAESRPALDRGRPPTGVVARAGSSRLGTLRGQSRCTAARSSMLLDVLLASGDQPVVAARDSGILLERSSDSRGPRGALVSNQSRR
jgi:hypothetical protein